MISSFRPLMFTMKSRSGTVGKRPLTSTISSAFVTRAIRGFTQKMIAIAEKQCEWCKKPFTSAQPHARCCSETCRKRLNYHRPQTQHEYTCKACGVLFKAKAKNRNTVCSVTCQGRLKIKPASEKVHHVLKPNRRQHWCNLCGSPFLSSYDDARWCSKVCRDFFNGCLRRIEKYWASQKPWVNDRVQQQCIECGKMFDRPRVARGRSRKWCSLACSLRMRARRRRHTVRAGRERGEEIGYHDIYVRHKGLCYWCGKPVDSTVPHNTPMAGTVDHVKAVANGGMHTYDNLVLSHQICNSLKSDSMPCIDAQGILFAV